MLPRKRIGCSLNFQTTDIIPLRIYAAPGGLYEHGQELLDLIQTCGHDFGDLSDLMLPDPPGKEDFDPDGRYHSIQTDAWGTTWEYRIFGIWGHPIDWPLNDLNRLDSYQPPQPPACQGKEFDTAKEKADIHKKQYYLLAEGGSLFEKLHSLRRFEDVLMDITLDTPEINCIADMIVENLQGYIQYALAIDCDGILFGDDFGTQTGLLLSPSLWRRFFKSRYQSLFSPLVQAGKKIFFHSCGQVMELLEDFKEMGVSAVWPQLPVYDLKLLVERCRDLQLAVELHPDRGDLMQKGTPDDIRRYMYDLIDTFDPLSGGAWLYIEIDPGFPWSNVETLFNVIMELRQFSY